MGIDIKPNTHLPANGLIKQPAASDLRTEGGSMQLVEKWKGQYTHCQAVAKALYSTNQVYYNAFTQSAGKLSAEYSTPSPPRNMVWLFAQATVDECDAGENGILQTVWNAVPDPEGQAGESWPAVETWHLEWQPENYDVYAYCKNPATHQTDERNGSQRVAVENCLHPPIGQNIMTQQALFTDNDGLVVALNENEKKILLWKLQGKHVIKHHPVIRKDKTWTNVPESLVNSIMQQASGEIQQADYVGMPGQTFGITAQWVCQGTNITMSQPDIKDNTYTFTASTEWQGALSVVVEFYGPDGTRWTFGEM